MITGKEGLLELMMEAFSMEKGTREFYRKASRVAHEEVARKAFAQLADWEAEHMNYIQYLYQSIMDDREMLSFAEFREKVRPEAVEGGIPMNVVEMRLADYEFTTETGALILALEIEGKSYSFYRRLSEQAEDPGAKAFMRDMMEWEKKHLQYLKELRLKIEETS
jgi:rubrerythrin